MLGIFLASVLPCWKPANDRWSWRSTLPGGSVALQRDTMTPSRVAGWCYIVISGLGGCL
jgi:hypothetical protein